MATGEALTRWRARALIALRVLFPGLCLACVRNLPPGQIIDLCHECWRALPWLQQSCVRCALPQAPSVESARASGNFRYICAECRATPPLYSRTVAPLRYADPVSLWITAFKDRMNLACGRTLGLLLASAALDTYGPAGPDVLVPVPLDAWRIARRGHNQAIFLARQVSRVINRPVLINGARRVRVVGPQRPLGRAARLTNVSGAFAASPRVAGRSVAIVDDVITTGSTATAMAEALRAAGATDIHVLAVARALRSG